jgi:hypothetical protein
MTFHIGDDPAALASIIRSLGGTIEDDASFSFPVAQLREANSKLDAMGIKISRVGYRVEEVPGSTNNKVRDVATFKAFKKDTGEMKMKRSVTNGLGT